MLLTWKYGKRGVIIKMRSFLVKSWVCSGGNRTVLVREWCSEFGCLSTGLFSVLVTTTNLVTNLDLASE